MRMQDFFFFPHQPYLGMLTGIAYESSFQLSTRSLNGNHDVGMPVKLEVTRDFQISLFRNPLAILNVRIK